MKYGIIGENFGKLAVLENTKTGETRENDDSLFIQINLKNPYKMINIWVPIYSIHSTQSIQTN